MSPRPREIGRGVCAVLVLAASAPGRATQQRPAFTSEVDLVAINVVVTDKHGRTVTNLTEDAFQVSEDNSPQRITHFTKDPIARYSGTRDWRARRRRSCTKSRR
jgi:hypothetical protein